MDHLNKQPDSRAGWFDLSQGEGGREFLVIYTSQQKENSAFSPNQSAVQSTSQQCYGADTSPEWPAENVDRDNNEAIRKAATCAPVVEFCHSELLGKSA